MNPLTHWQRSNVVAQNRKTDRLRLDRKRVVHFSTNSPAPLSRLSTYTAMWRRPAVISPAPACADPIVLYALSVASAPVRGTTVMVTATVELLAATNGKNS